MRSHASSAVSSLRWRARGELRPKSWVLLEKFLHFLLIFHLLDGGQAHTLLSLVKHGLGDFSLDFGIEVLQIIVFRIDLADIDLRLAFHDVFPPALELGELLNSKVQSLARSFVGLDGPEAISGLG